MACKEDLSRRAEKLKSMVGNWIPKRTATVRTLRVLADELQKHHNNVCIAQVAGTSTSIAGVLTAGVGFGLSFVTGGASLVAAAGIIGGIGAGFGAAGGVVNAGSSLAEVCIEKDTLNTAQRLIDEDREACKAIEKVLLEFEEEASKSMISKGFKVGGCTVSMLKSCAVVGYKVSARAARTAAPAGGEALFRGLSKVGKVVHIGGFVFSVAKLPTDIRSLVTNSKEVHAARRGRPGKEPEKVRKLRELADELEKGISQSRHQFDKALDEFLSNATSPDSDQKEIDYSSSK